MSNPENNPKKNEGHNGYIWSPRAQLLFALLLALMSALLTARPALAGLHLWGG